MTTSEFDGRVLICLTTFPDREVAEEVVTALVKERLVVCGQIGADLISLYRWQDQLCRDPEVAVSLKIRDDRLAAAWERLRTLHPYEVPQLLCWPASGVDAAYGRWAWEDEA